MLVIAGWISVTRVQDYKHRQSDIFCGAVLGISAALLLLKLIKPTLDTICKEQRERRKTITEVNSVTSVV